MNYLVVLVLSGCHVQFKSLFDQPSLPLSLSLRAVRRESGAVMLISSMKKTPRCVNNAAVRTAWKHI